MNSHTFKRFSLLATALLALSACEPAEEDSCPDENSYDQDGQEFCVYQQDVTETGFDCPSDLPNRVNGPTYTICAGSDAQAGSLGDERIGEIEAGYAQQVGDPTPPAQTPPAQTPTSSLSVNGSLEIAATPSGMVMDADALTAVWMVTSSSPDYNYVFGAGSVDMQAETFSIDFTTPPPSDAINSYGVGVAILIAYDSSELTVSQGIGDAQTDQAFEGIYEAGTIATGVTDDYAVIYVEPSAPEAGLLDWAKSFPKGYSCGQGTPAAAGDTFDTFTPIPCDQVILRFDDSHDFVNWT